MKKNSTQRFKKWLKIHKPRKITDDFLNLSTGFQLYAAMMVYLMIKPEAKNLNFFVFTFLLCLFLLVNSFKKIEPFKKRKSDYVYTIIFGGLFISNFLELYVWKFLNSQGINTTLNQQIINETFQNHQDKVLELNLTQIILAPIFEETLFRLFFLCIALYLFKFFNFTDKVAYICFVIVSSISFGFAHSFDNPLTSIPYILFGLTFSITFIVSRSIYVPVAIHIINNGISSLHVFIDKGLILNFFLLSLIFLFIEYFHKNKLPYKL